MFFSFFSFLSRLFRGALDDGSRPGGKDREWEKRECMGEGWLLADDPAASSKAPAEVPKAAMPCG